jgi:BlaR1 peptidase M56
MVEDWQQWVAPGAAWVLTYLIHSTLLIAAVWLISRRLEGRPSALDALWKTALVGGLVTATLQTAAGVSPLGGRLDLATSAPLAAADKGEGDTRSPALAPATKEATAPATAPWSVSEPDRAGSASATDPEPAASASKPGSTSDPKPAADAAMGSAPDSASGTAPGAASAAETDADSDTGSATATLAGPRSSSSPGAGRGSAPENQASSSGSVSVGNARLWIAAGFLAWAALAAFFGLGLIRSWWRLRHVLADRRPIVGGPATTMLARLAAGTMRRVRLSASTRVDVPIAIGVLRPEIVLPERALYQLEPAELESMLAHELAHLVRRDPAWRLLTGCIHRVLFLQPLNRMVAVHLESASEVLCDDWAVERTDRPLALARCLTEVAGWVASPLGESVPAMARRGSGLGRRVRRLVAAGMGPAPRGKRDRWPLPLSAGVLALVVFAAPGATEMSGMRAPTPLPPAPKLISASSGAEQAEPARGATERKLLETEKKDDARRLLGQLRSGRVGDHDVSDWIALAQLLGSPDKSSLGQLLGTAGNAGAFMAGAGGPGLSADEIEGIIEGAVTQALGGTGIDVDIDFDVEVDEDGDIDVHINSIDVKGRPGDDHDDVDEDAGFDFDFDFGVPDFDVEVEVPDPPDPPDFDPPEPPEPPEPPDFECDDDDDHGNHHDHQHWHHHGGLTDEQRRQIQEHARQAREHARQARKHALQQAAEARRQAHEQRKQALQQAEQAREQALRQAAEARAQALRQAEQAREHAMRQHRDNMRGFERAMRDADRERQRQYKEMWRNLKEQEREWLREQEQQREQGNQEEEEGQDDDENQQSL